MKTNDKFEFKLHQPHSFRDLLERHLGFTSPAPHDSTRLWSGQQQSEFLLQAGQRQAPAANADALQLSQRTIPVAELGLEEGDAVAVPVDAPSADHPRQCLVFPCCD